MVHDEGALDIDLDGAGVYYGAVYLSSVCSHAPRFGDGSWCLARVLLRHDDGSFRWLWSQKRADVQDGIGGLLIIMKYDSRW